LKQVKEKPFVGVLPIFSFQFIVMSARRNRLHKLFSYHYISSNMPSSICSFKYPQFFFMWVSTSNFHVKEDSIVKNIWKHCSREFMLCSVNTNQIRNGVGQGAQTHILVHTSQYFQFTILFMICYLIIVNMGETGHQVQFFFIER